MLQKVLVYCLLATLRFTIVYAQVGDESKDVEQLQIQLVRVNDEAKQSRENQPVFESLSKQLDVPVSALQADQESTGFGFGQLFIAHSLAQASGQSFEEIAEQFKSGKGWGVIAKENDVKLGKVVSGLKRTGDELKSVRMRSHEKQEMRANHGEGSNRGRAGTSHARGPAAGPKAMGKGRH